MKNKISAYININENKIYISFKYHFNNLTINILDNNNNNLYSLTNSFEIGEIWISPSIIISTKKYIKINFIQGNNFFSYIININIGIKIPHSSLGDALNVTPIIKEFSKAYNRKIDIYTYLKEIFINNPYINKIYDFDDIQKNTILYTVGSPTINDNFKQRLTNLIDCCSMDLGFTLPPHLKTLEFYPNEQTISLPNKYICIAPLISWKTRTYPKEMYQDLIYKINDIGYQVVLIGKSNYSIHNKSVFKNFNGYILDLIDKLDISNSWHIINNSDLFITTDNGLLHLAGTTDSNILFLASNIDPESRLPFRNGSLYYKSDYIIGDCDIYCGSNLKYVVSTLGIIKHYPLISDKCFKNYDTYKCFATPYKIIKKIKKILNISESTPK